MSEPKVLFQIVEHVAIVTLNRPDRVNALDEDMHVELRHVFDRIELDRAVRAVLLTGAGRAFCAGQDLAERQLSDAELDLGAALERSYNPLIKRIRALERPVVCAVNGVAAGAGANLALACDIVLAGRSASFIQAFCRLGLIPDAGGTFLLPRLVGRARALGLMLLGEPLSAEQAAEWGLIWQVVEDDALAETAWALCLQLAAGPTRALGLIKRAVNAGTVTLEEQLALERDLQREAGRSEDFAEGLAAFLGKRPPSFKGR